MDRRAILDLALSAYTLDECLAAERALAGWLAAHPDDLGLHEVAGSLGLAKAAAQGRQAEGPPRSGAVLTSARR
jgi:hypothetical protein